LIKRLAVIAHGGAQWAVYNAPMAALPVFISTLITDIRAMRHYVQISVSKLRQGQLGKGIS
jgi:hypothetical protein